jgi:hypothetical protein
MKRAYAPSTPTAAISAERPAHGIGSAARPASRKAETRVGSKATPKQVAPQLRFIYAASGVEVKTDCSFVSRYIRHAMDLEYYLGPMAETLEWPMEFFYFVAKTIDGEDICVKYVHLIAHRTQTMVRDLQQDMDGNVTVQVVVLPPPRVYDGGWCACAFDSCCLLCNVPGGAPCEGCGNCGCCRCGNCGHKCCEDSTHKRDAGDAKALTHQFLQRCSYSGCRQDWFAEFPWPLEDQEVTVLPAGFQC